MRSKRNQNPRSEDKTGGSPTTDKKTLEVAVGRAKATAIIPQIAGDVKLFSADHLRRQARALEREHEDRAAHHRGRALYWANLGRYCAKRCASHLEKSAHHGRLVNRHRRVRDALGQLGQGGAS